MPKTKPADFEIRLSNGKTINTFDDLEIRETGLSKAAENQASTFAWYAMLSARCKSELREARLEFDFWQAKEGEDQRDVLSEGGEKKVTETQIKKTIMAMQEYKRRQDRIAELEQRADLLSATCEALRQKKDMIVMLGSDRRAELYGEVHIKDRETEDEVTSDYRRTHSTKRNK